MSNIQLAVFDIAGTTVKDKGNVSIAFMNAFKEYNLEVAKEAVSKVMGFRKKDAIRMLLEKSAATSPDNNHELIEKIHDAFTRNIISSYETDSELKPMPQAEELFAVLKQWGIKIALNTGFTRAVTDTILQRLQWTKLPAIDMVICSDEVPQGRPFPYMIHSIMLQMDVTDSRAVVKIGDTKVDVEEGRNAGCGMVVSVTTGAYSRNELEICKPDHIIDSLEELPALL
jgi:phosphonatase-like hydrolase